MIGNWVIDEENKAIIHKLSGLTFKWCVTAGEAVLAPFPHPVTEEEASYLSLLKEAKNIIQKTQLSPKE